VAEVRVRYASILLRDVTRTPDEAIKVDDHGARLGGLLEHVAARHGPALGGALFSEEGDLRPHFHVLVNGRNIRLLAGLDTRLQDGDTVSLITPIGGG
jgi:MoaD family protein